MVTQLINGHRTWEATSDENGFLDYKITYRVLADPTDGPTNVLFTPGLPLYGSWWIVDADVNIWAWRRWNAEVRPVVSDEPNNVWDVTYTFSTKWPSPKDGDRPHDPDPPDDPRLENPKISGSFVRYTQEETMDRFGNPIVNSAFELLRGPQVEFDRNRMQIKIEVNTAILPLSMLVGMADTVNAYELWGIPPRCIKLSEPDFELSFFGQGIFYWKVKLTFDIDLGTWDRDLLDEGTKCLHGTWDSAPGSSGNWKPLPIGTDNLGHPIPPDPNNPQHYSRFKDRNGEPCRVVLNGAGLPAGVGIGGGTTQQTVLNSWMWIDDVAGNSPESPDVGSGGPNGWIKVYRPSTKVSTWTTGVTYYPGAIVYFTPPYSGLKQTYLCLRTNNSVSPVGSGSWAFVPESFVPVNKGNWESSGIYDPGNIVTTPGTITVNQPMVSTGPPGNIHVERYPGTDFSLLGIPLVLPNVE